MQTNANLTEMLSSGRGRPVPDSCLDTMIYVQRHERLYKNTNNFNLQGHE
ncbi:hypothetical protein K443DRAFT_15924 [Laccaria amethystina LaAM-08-1]|uniref:Uncharacterized protein n=1 Tax=Laccaria amethystina LaAM-08-1 TaxID=1095629 RepID=A0A0C9WKN8_9AGAR|nr:hypothetical protein K443DRAFT_15924 [Laccaria amethystina LaAM-08-1]